MKGALKFKHTAIVKQAGEKARLIVVGGPDHGNIFVVKSDRVTIGRGEENEIILMDLKVSRKHAELLLQGNSAIVRDMGSSHGLMVNGAFQKQCPLRTGDRIGLGTTVLEFVGAESLDSPLQLLPPMTTSEVGTGDSGLTKFIPKPAGYGKTASKSTGIGTNGVAGKTSFIERNKKLLLILGVLMALAALLPEVEQKQRAKKNKYLEPQDLEAGRLTGLKPPNVDQKTVHQADIYFKEGFREFRAHNYIRAQVAFETALQIFGDHALARMYLESTKKAMEDEAKEHFKTAKRDEEANRLREAMMHYDAVKRLFEKDQSNPLYKQADQQATDLQKRMDDLDN